MAATNIDWAEHVWNPVTGCSKISAGCQHCYAERMAKRLAGRHGYPAAPNQFKVTLHEDKLTEPLKRKHPTRYFVCSMADLFHDDVPFKFIDDMFGVMTACTRHTFMVLTKRPARMLEFLKQYYLPGAKTDHILFGVTAENQETADQRIPLLLKIPVAAKKFVSVEPMLGPVDLLGAILPMSIERSPVISFEGTPVIKAEYFSISHIQWVICGGETGTNARPMHPDWVRGLRDQCVDGGIPFFFKQWGELVPVFEGKDGLVQVQSSRDWLRVEKKTIGRQLDGRTWDQYPWEQPQ